MGTALFLVFLIVLFIVGMPVGFSLGIASMVVMAGQRSGIKFGTIIQQMIGGVNTFTLLAVPLFLLAGKLMNLSGITDKLFHFARIVVGWLPGGLGHVNVLASIIFAGMSGTAVSDASGLGVVEIKAMKDAGFDGGFSCSVTAASSTVGPIIPPSLPLVVYGTMSGASVGALFIAGILPGLLMAAIMMVVVAIYAHLKSYPRDKFPTFKEFLSGLKDGFLPLMAPVIILLGIYTGLFTPTEAAAIVVFYSLLLGVVVYRELDWKTLHAVLKETVSDAATIGLIVAGATLYGNVIIKAMIPQTLLELVTSAITSKYVMLFVINIFLLVVGMFLETTSAITILMPLLLPILNEMGIDLVHFGIIIVLNLMIGVLTPPFGIVLFVTSRIGDISIQGLTKALLPWLAALFFALMLVTYIPQISLIMPQMAGLI
ncbi:MAG: TRAP transporter large permease [Eubacteriales bacterium]|jgi:tripartite ATP-independent transporter DctM subunit